MQSRKNNKFNKLNKTKNKWITPLIIGGGLLILFVPIIWLGLHNWDVEESLSEVGYSKVNCNLCKSLQQRSER